MTEHLKPETYEEVQIVMDLVWGDYPALKTVGDIKAEADRRIAELRQRRETIMAAYVANPVGTLADALMNDMRVAPPKQSRGPTATHLVYDELRDT